MEAPSGALPRYGNSGPRTNRTRKRATDKHIETTLEWPDGKPCPHANQAEQVITMSWPPNRILT